MDNYLLILIVASLLFFAYFYKNDAISLYRSLTTCPLPSKKISIQPKKKTINKKKNITESDNSNSDGDDRSYLSSNDDISHMSNDSNKSGISDNTKLSGATHSESMDFLESDNSIDLGSNDIKSIGSDYSGISGYSGLSNVSD